MLKLREISVFMAYGALEWARTKRSVRLRCTTNNQKSRLMQIRSPSWRENFVAQATKARWRSQCMKLLCLLMVLNRFFMEHRTALLTKNGSKNGKNDFTRIVIFRIIGGNQDGCRF